MTLLRGRNSISIECTIISGLWAWETSPTTPDATRTPLAPACTVYRQLSILPMDRGPDYYRGQLYVRGCHRIRKPMLLPRSSTGGHPDGRAWPLGAAPPMWAHAVGACIAGG